MAAEVLKKKIQELMKERDDAIDKGEALESELSTMKEELLKVHHEPYVGFGLHVIIIIYTYGHISKVRVISSV